MTEYTPRNSFNLEEHLNRTIEPGTHIMPGISPETVEYKQTCTAITTNVRTNTIEVCAWNEDAQEITQSLRQQEVERVLADPSYVPKFIAHTICDYHKKIMLAKVNKEL